MNMKIAIFAVCVGTVALAQADNARANYANASDPVGSELVYTKLDGHAQLRVMYTKFAEIALEYWRGDFHKRIKKKPAAGEGKKKEKKKVTPTPPAPSPVNSKQVK